MKNALAQLQQTALQVWVPAWMRSFRDATHGGFHEALGSTMEPTQAPKRLLTQCRQLYVYSHAALLDPKAAAPYLHDLHQAFAFLLRHYHVASTGGWRFSVAPNGTCEDPTYDLYAHAFAILALGFYARATGSAQAATHARDTLSFIETHFRAPVGFHEQLAANLQPLPRVRRQNPHMHLFEACLFTYENSGDRAYLTMADSIYGLFESYFFDPSTQTLCEFFTADLQHPDPQRGHLVETGHHYEWIWLLNRYIQARPHAAAAVQPYLSALYEWAERHGVDRTNGGIFNTVSRFTGKVHDANRRIWHVTEALKARSIMGTLTTPFCERLGRWVNPHGGWTETLDDTMAPNSTTMPGTTPYHLFMGIAETCRILTDETYAY